MKRWFLMHFAILLLLGGTFTVLAHHGWADFDRSKKVEVNGVIVESKYENPVISCGRLIAFFRPGTSCSI